MAHARTLVVSRIATLVPTIARVTTLLVSRIPALVSTLIDTVLLIVAAVGLLSGIVLHLLAVVEVLAVGFDHFVGFATGETGEDVFGHGVVLGDACERMVLMGWSGREVRGGGRQLGEGLTNRWLPRAFDTLSWP